MNPILNNILYNVDKARFDIIRDMAKSFNAICNGNNIVQDDIFNVIKNYGHRQSRQIEIIRMPVNDDDFCACTFVRNGRIFIVSNSHLPSYKQFFAAAHELYHIIRYINGDDEDYPTHGSILKAGGMDEKDVEAEDRDANAFAGLFLVPSNALMEQIDIYGIPVNNFSIKEVIRLMDIFAVPYKAIIFRLYEDNLINVRKADELLSIENKTVEDEINTSGVGMRWYRNDKDVIEFGSLKEKLLFNEKSGFITDTRAASDKNRINELIEDIQKRGEV